jgi:hypothetical protein
LDFEVFTVGTLIVVIDRIDRYRRGRDVRAAAAGVPDHELVRDTTDPRA